MKNVVVESYRGRRFPRVNAVDFDGTNDYLTRGADLTGIADGKTGTLSFWLLLNGGDGVAQRVMSTTNNRFTVARTSANQVNITGRAVGGASVNLENRSTNTLVAASGWTHIMASWDLAAGVSSMWFDDVQETLATNTIVNGDIEYTDTDVYIGSNATPGNFLNGALSQLWFSLTFIDLTVKANRRKFITDGGRPVDLGWDGRRPTGSAPILFLRGHVDSWQVNQGTGGGFTENGALTTAATTPST